MKRLLLIIAFLTLSLEALSEELAVIVNKSNPIKSISKGDLKKIYLGKMKRFGSGTKIKIADYKKGKKLRKKFYKKIAGRSEKDINNYWYRLVFTGKSVPPVPLDGHDSILEFVAENDGGIGYIPKDKVSGDVKSVLIIKI